jgi:hypothetical protein
MGRLCATAVRSRRSAEAGGYLVAVLATAAALFRWLLAPWLGDDQPPATLDGSVAVAVCGGSRPGLTIAALGCLACNPSQGGLPMVLNLSPGDVVRIGDDVTLTVLTVEDDLIRFGLESPEGCPGADTDCERADLKPLPAGWELN